LRLEDIPVVDANDLGLKRVFEDFINETFRLGSGIGFIKGFDT